jgi:hypothetical protein
MTRPSKRLAIDATIAQAAGANGSPEQIGVKCRDLLVAVRQVCHRMLMTDDFRREWDAHQSNFSAKWRTLMQREQGKVVWLGAEHLGRVSLDLAPIVAVPSELAIMNKDLHLVRAALATDGIVISLDDEARRCFARTAVRLHAIGAVMWLDPRMMKDPGDWLRKGAPVVDGLLLRSFQP